MLVLTRKKNDKIIVRVGGEAITIVVVEIQGFDKRVRLGLDASPNVLIDREEVFAAKERERLA